MQKPVFHHGSTRRWPFWSALIALAVAAFFAVGPKHDGPFVAGPGATSTQKSGYVNRARWSTPTAPPGEAAPRMPSITGAVYDLTGAPLAGAVIAATTFEVAGNFPTTAASVSSDERGRFELRVPNGSYNLIGNKEGYGSTLVMAHSSDEISIVLPKSGVVQGYVLNERKEPVTRFTIDVITMAPDSTAAPAPLLSKRFDSPDGSFRIAELPGWPVILRAIAPDYAPAFSSLVAVGPGQTQDLDLTLSSGCTLTGTVKDEGGAPLPNVFLDAEARLGAGMTSSASMDAASQAESDPQGRFRLEHVPPGEVLVRGYDGSHAATTLHVQVSECDKLNPVKLTMSTGGSLAGVVRGSDGKPIAGARLTATQRSIGFVDTVTDAEGRYRFDQLPPVVVRLELQKGGQRTVMHASVKEGETIEQDITLFGKGSGEIRGRVTAGGRPLQGFQVTVVCNQGPSGLDAHYLTTGDDGTYRATDLPNGSYLVTVASAGRAAGAHVRDGSVETVDLDVAERPNTTAAVVPASATK